ncbi:hypothetical protein ABZT49_03800 [Methylobacterium sp. EM32]|uniref:hypothetical protein n=1 Tax=Methylobacterium sp. EM32 TaxID=3163481 RepID=UPI0033A2927A
MTTARTPRPFEKLPARVRRIVERCRAGQTLCLAHRVREIGPPLCWFEPSGRPTRHRSALDAIASGHLVPSTDGLFGEDTAQTWQPGASGPSAPAAG